MDLLSDTQKKMILLQKRVAEIKQLQKELRPLNAEIKGCKILLETLQGADVNENKNKESNPNENNS